MYSAAQIFKTSLVPALVLLPAPGPGIQRDMARDIDQLQRAECEYRGISASFSEVTRAYLLQAYENGELIRWQARPSPYNPETETLVTAVFTASAPKNETTGFRPDGPAAGITWRYSTLAATRITAHGAHAEAAMAVFRRTVDDFVDRMVYAPAATALRATADPDAAPAFAVAAGEVLLVEEQSGEWIRVRRPSTTENGWLPRREIRAVDN